MPTVYAKNGKKAKTKKTRFFGAAEIFAKKITQMTPNFSLCKNPKKTRFSTILKKTKWNPSRILLKISGFFQKNTFFWTKYPV